jgi:RNA polymerase sigma-70 factor (ECF subfamily)
LREEKYFSTWVVSIFINECRKILKYKKREKSLEYMAELKCEEDIRKTDIKLDITIALKLLDETFRDAVILKYYSGYSQEEIAEILEIPIGTVKSRIYRGIKALKNILEKEGRS